MAGPHCPERGIIRKGRGSEIVRGVGCSQTWGPPAGGRRPGPHGDPGGPCPEPWPCARDKPEYSPEGPVLKFPLYKL